MIPSDVTVDPRPVSFLPVIREITERLGIRAVVEQMSPKDPRARVSDGDCVTLMIQNILQGRCALYSMADWLELTDPEVVLGPDCPADAFNDARLAACLDHLYECGTDEVLSAVVKVYLNSEEAPDEYSVHGDTTSISVYGAMANRLDLGGPLATHGWSKDYRPDLKQLVFGLSLHGAVGIPLTSAMLDGNTSDHFANRLHIDQLADLLPDDDDVTLVADCKLFDAHTLGQLLLQGFHFVTMVPASFGLRRELVEVVRQLGDPVPELARGPGRTKAYPDRVYSGLSFQRTFTVGLTKSVGDNHMRDVDLRFVVVESSQLASNFERGLKRKLHKEEEAFRAAFKRAAKKPFGCHDDAQAALDKVLGRRLSFHRVEAEVRAETVAVRRTRRGRPRKGEVAPSQTVYNLVLTDLVRDQEAIETARFHARHFVLATDHLAREQWSDQRVLQEYRHQHMIEGHTGFRWIKSIAEVAPVLLETPRRIAALGLIFVLALMVRNFIQFTLRHRLAQTDQTVLDRKKRPTQKPTTETALLRFAGVIVVRYIKGAEELREVKGLTDHCRTVLAMLHIPEETFTKVRRITAPDAAATSGM